MDLIILCTALTFVFYFLASFNSINFEQKIIFVSLFFISSFTLRYLINPNLNKDYYGYFDIMSFETKDSLVSFLLSEPYLYIIYNFFNFFSTDRVFIFLEIYWFNFFITNIFFIWLLTRRDVQMWKKMVLFVFYYFLFAFVLLRNGPAYILFGLYFYYSFRGIKYNKVLFTPFFHLSSVPFLVVFFHKKKNYFLFFSLLLFFLVPFLLLVVMPMLSNIMALQSSMSKADSYSEEMEVVSVFHKIYFLFITVVLLISCFLYQKKIINPIIVTTLVLYYVGFFINPVIGFRFTPYIFFAILLFNFDGSYNVRFTRLLNLISFFLFPYFLFTLLDTHYL